MSVLLRATPVRRIGRLPRASSAFVLSGVFAIAQALSAQVATANSSPIPAPSAPPIVVANLGDIAASPALPEAPSALLLANAGLPPSGSDTFLHPSGAAALSSASGDGAENSLEDESSSDEDSQTPDASAGQDRHGEPAKKPAPAAGQQPKRILGLMPNYRSVSAGAIPPPPTFKQNFRVATRQAFDYSSFIFLGITSGIAEAEDAHPSIDTVNGGHAVFYAYTWRGFLDKTDGTYQSAWILPSLLHEDTRYYALGEGSKWKRLAYAASRVAIARTYGGRMTPNFAGLGGKVGAQAVSRYYYPPGATSFGVLATKFAYACARDMGFTVFREFYPDIAVHVLHRAP